jgi:hypothetical protein
MQSVHDRVNPLDSEFIAQASCCFARYAVNFSLKRAHQATAANIYGRNRYKVFNEQH